MFSPLAILGLFRRPAVLVAILVAGIAIYALYTGNRAASLRIQNHELTAQLKACRLAETTRSKDKERDSAIDAIPDDDLRGAASEWLLPF